MNIELLIPVFFFAIVAVIMPAIILAGLIIFAAHEAVERRRSELSTATEVDLAFISRGSAGGATCPQGAS